LSFLTWFCSQQARDRRGAFVGGQSSKKAKACFCSDARVCERLGL
jgi:hypothetical protein